MRLKVGEIEIEAATEQEFEWLRNQIASLQTLQPLKTKAPSGELRVVPLSTGDRIRRTKDEQARGLTIEEAIAERRANQGLPKIQDDNAGATFQPDLSEDDLVFEVPLDDE